MTLAFVRLMAAWLLRLASPPCAAGQVVQLPLPTPAAVEFRALPVRAPRCLPCLDSRPAA